MGNIAMGPMLLIGAGVLLLVIALIVLVVQNKKSK